MKTTFEEIKGLGKITLEDLKDALSPKVNGDRAMQVADQLMKPLLEGKADYSPTEFTAGCLMALMRILTGASEVLKRREAGENYEDQVV